MCGIVGIAGRSAVNYRLYEALTMLQHRGQDAAGMATNHHSRVHLHKANGLVREVFQEDDLYQLTGNLGIGQVRYPTTGTDSVAEAQPLYVNSPYGMVMAHNGNLTNTAPLAKELFETDLRHVNTGSDSEVLLNVFAHEIARCGGLKLTPSDIFAAVGRVHKRCDGAYAAVVIIVGFGMVAFRDGRGVRPLVIGSREVDGAEGHKGYKHKGYKEYIVASESVALDALDFTLWRDLGAGEVFCVTEQGEMQTQQCAEQVELTPCIFEYAYLARPDSMLDNISVYKSRLRAGERLADRVKESFGGGQHDIDVVIPIPDTSRTAALPLAYKLNVKYREGFIKNRYIGRTFIMPNHKQRQNSVKRKLNAIELEFRGKNVLLVDDSIVRGTTSRQIIRMARQAGAKRVYFASASPPVRYPNIYGIDMPSTHELVAADKTDDQVRQAIGADKLVYQELDDLVESSREGNTNIKQFECSMFDGKYLSVNDCSYSKTQLARVQAES